MRYLAVWPCFAVVLLVCRPMLAEEQLLLIASPADPPVIYACSLNMETGEFGPLRVAADEVSTGFMARHPKLPIVYAATSEPGAEPNGGVRAYQLDRRQHALSLINTASTQDKGTTHIEVDRDGKVVVVCHYGGEGTSAIPLQDDGSLQQKVSRIRHEGSSVHPQRQQRHHPHGVAIAPGGKFVCVADLGTDHVDVFRLNDQLQLSKSSHWQAAPGAGPRHVSFHPSGKWLYCINELDSTIAVLVFDGQTGSLTETQTVSTLPDGFTGDNTTAEVVVHPSGKFLYGSNRGHESTAVFSIDAESGHLRLVEHEPTQGKHPRFVGLDPTGRMFVAANMNTNNLVSFRIDAESGRLEPTGHQQQVARPMCVLFIP